MENSGKVQVAVVRGANRRGAVAEALSLIAGELAFKVASRTVIVPHLAIGSKSGASTHPDTISASVDALLAAGAESLTIAAVSPRARGWVGRRFDDLGYRGEVWGRPVSFLDLAEDPAEDSHPDAFQRGAEVGHAPFVIPREVANSDCRVFLGMGQNSGRLGGSPAFSNLLNVLSLEGRARLSSRVPPHRRSILSCAQRFWNRSNPEYSEAHWRALVSLAQAVRPTLSIIEAFPATKRSIPLRSLWARHGMVIAGLDQVAVDTIAARLLGYDLSRLGYLRLAESVGLGVSNPDRIEIIGDRPIRVDHGSEHALRMHWRSRRHSTARSRVQPR